MGQTHTTRVFASCDAKNMSNRKVADKIVSIFNKTKGPELNETEVQLQGFRAEFEGLPVLPRWTGQTFTTSANNMYWGPGTHKLMEYATVEIQEGKVCLCNYYGPAGNPWNEEAQEVLIKALEEVTGQEVTRVKNK